MNQDIRDLLLYIVENLPKYKWKGNIENTPAGHELVVCLYNNNEYIITISDVNNESQIQLSRRNFVKELEKSELIFTSLLSREACFDFLQLIK